MVTWIKWTIAGVAGVSAISGSAIGIHKHLSNVAEESWNKRTKALETKIAELTSNNDEQTKLKKIILGADNKTELDLDTGNKKFKDFNIAKASLKKWCSNPKVEGQSTFTKEQLTKDYCN